MSFKIQNIIRYAIQKYFFTERYVHGVRIDQTASVYKINCRWMILGKINNTVMDTTLNVHFEKQN